VRGGDPVIVSFKDMQKAWQALEKVNPDNPLAVAEAVPELVTVLEVTLPHVAHLYLSDRLAEVLAKVHAKGGD